MQRQNSIQSTKRLLLLFACASFLSTAISCSVLLDTNELTRGGSTDSSVDSALDASVKQDADTTQPDLTEDTTVDSIDCPDKNKVCYIDNLSGTCRVGRIKCDGSGNGVCTQVDFPTSDEPCNGVDDNCDGKGDGYDLVSHQACAAGSYCDPIEKHCEKGCRANEECTNGNKCRTVNGDCPNCDWGTCNCGNGPGCEDNFTCENKVCKCKGKICGQGEYCTDDGACACGDLNPIKNPNGKVCTTGICISGSCKVPQTDASVDTTPDASQDASVPDLSPDVNVDVTPVDTAPDISPDTANIDAAPDAPLDAGPTG